MLYWQMVLAAADKERIDCKPDQARGWIRRCLPGMTITVIASGKKIRQERFDWKREWPTWQDNFRALRWLANCRARGVEPRAIEDRIPYMVHSVVESVLNRTTNTIFGHYLSEARLSVSFSGEFNSQQRISA